MRTRGPREEGRGWSPRVEPPPLPPGEVHVWRAPLDVSAGISGALEHALSPDELERARRFATPALRAGFVASQGTLRRVLAGYLGVPSAVLRFGRGDHGKPFLLEPAGTGLCFNHSHSGALVLVAVVRGVEVGVDVEAPRDLGDMLALARRFFSPAEAATLAALAPGDRPAAFLTAWTRKEAFVKATGRGITQPLSSFSVAFAPGEPARLVAQDGEPEAPRRWVIHDLDPAPGYAAALALQCAGCTVRTFTWVDQA